MRKLLALSLAFGLGFLTHGLVKADNSRRVTGIGGIFFKSHDPVALKEWYSRHLGLTMDEYGSKFEWQTSAGKPACTQWTVFGSKSKYFDPSTSNFMINYRVTDLESLLADLRGQGVTVVDKMEVYSYGRFVHILDLDGNKIELWEPID